MSNPSGAFSAAEAIRNSQQWASNVHRDMIAANLLDPNLICFRSVATDEPESIIRADLMNQMAKEYKPKPRKELQSFLPHIH